MVLERNIECLNLLVPKLWQKPDYWRKEETFLQKKILCRFVVVFKHRFFFRIHLLFFICSISYLTSYWTETEQIVNEMDHFWRKYPYYLLVKVQAQIFKKQTWVPWI